MSPRFPLAVAVALGLAACGGGNNPDVPDATPTSTVCSDSVDNDGDGSTDYPADPGCDSPTDADENNAPIAMCADGRDNDGDGKVDYPNDPGCFSLLQNSEADDCPAGPNCPQCSNGVDDDDDSHIDYPDDDGCMAASGADEFGVDPNACGPGLTVVQLTGSPVTGSIAAAPSHFTSHCGGGGAEVAYELILHEPHVVVATTVFPGTTVDTSLYVRSDCLDADTEMACNDNQDASTLGSTITVSLPEGRFFIIVDARTINEAGNFQLGYSLFAGEGVPCTDSLECGPGLQCRIPNGGTEMICTDPICSDDFDDDGDGFDDFPDDPGCTGPGDFDEVDDCPDGPNCPACANTLDDDNDGHIDFPDDPDCQSASQPAEGCNAENDPIHVQTTATSTGTTTGASNDFFASCDFSGVGGVDVTTLITVPAMQNLHVDDSGTGFTASLTMRDQTCDNELACDVSGFGGGEIIETGPLAAGSYALVVDGYFGGMGNYQLNVSGTIAPLGACDGQLATSGAISCPVGYACLGGVCLGNLECNNGTDDDGDGESDYPLDPGCVGPNDTTEADDCPSGPNCPECSNGIDDDGDFAIDYPADNDCIAASDDGEEEPACTAETDPVVNFTGGTLTGTTVGASDDMMMTCDFGFGDGPDIVALVDLPAMESLHFDSIGTTFDDVIALLDPNCSNTLGCQDFGGPGGESIDVSNTPAGVYNFVMDGYDALSGAYTVHLSGTIAPLGACDGALASSGAIACPSGYTCTGGICLGTLECNNGVDDDGDGFPGYPTDPGCATANDDDETDDCPSGPTCATCSNDLDDDGNGDIDYPDDASCISAGGTEGTCGQDSGGVQDVVIPLYAGSTIGGGDDFSPTCVSGSPSQDRAFHLKLPIDVDLLRVDTIGSDFYTVLSVMDETCTGTLACDADSAGFGSSLINMFNVSAGDYGIIVDGYFGDGNYMLSVRGTVASGAACTSPLFSTGVLVCPANHICTAGTCQPL